MIAGIIVIDWYRYIQQPVQPCLNNWPVWQLSSSNLNVIRRHLRSTTFTSRRHSSTFFTAVQYSGYDIHRTSHFLSIIYTIGACTTRNPPPPFNSSGLWAHTYAALYCCVGTMPTYQMHVGRWEYCCCNVFTIILLLGHELCWCCYQINSATYSYICTYCCSNSADAVCSRPSKHAPLASRTSIIACPTPAGNAVLLCQAPINMYARIHKSIHTVLFIKGPDWGTLDTVRYSLFFWFGRTLGLRRRRPPTPNKRRVCDSSLFLCGSVAINIIGVWYAVIRNVGLPPK